MILDSNFKKGKIQDSNFKKVKIQDSDFNPWSSFKAIFWDSYFKMASIQDSNFKKVGFRIQIWAYRALLFLTTEYTLPKFWQYKKASLWERVPFTLRKELWNPLLLQSHITFVYLQRNIVDNNKVNSRKLLWRGGVLVALMIMNLSEQSSKSPWLLHVTFPRVCLMSLTSHEEGSSFQ